MTKEIPKILDEKKFKFIIGSKDLIIVDGVDVSERIYEDFLKKNKVPKLDYLKEYNKLAAQVHKGNTANGKLAKELREQKTINEKLGKDNEKYKMYVATLTQKQEKELRKVIGDSNKKIDSLNKEIKKLKKSLADSVKDSKECREQIIAITNESIENLEKMDIMLTTEQNVARAAINKVHSYEKANLYSRLRFLFSPTYIKGKDIKCINEKKSKELEKCTKKT